MAEKILIVEDDLTLQETLTYNFTSLGYETECTDNGQTAIDLARAKKPDLIILDIMLPGIDGFEVCRILRQEMLVPILMLTARDDEIDRVVGLEVGADDYLIKPFSMRELTARVKALLRRVHALEKESKKEKSEIHQFGNLIIDKSRHEVKLNNETVELKPKEYELLLFFAEHQGRVLSRETILQQVWGWEYFGDSRTVDVHVRWLREKIETSPANPLRIITVRSAGYLFEG